MATLTREQVLRVQSAQRHYQEMFDRAYASWGLRAAVPVYSDSVESVNDYRRDEAVRAKKLLPFSEVRAAPGDATFAQLRRTKYWESPTTPIRSSRSNCCAPWQRLAVAMTVCRSVNFARYTKSVRMAKSRSGSSDSAHLLTTSRLRRAGLLTSERIKVQSGPTACQCNCDRWRKPIRRNDMRPPSAPGRFQATSGMALRVTRPGVLNHTA
jgi:hypothetical protein